MAIGEADGRDGQRGLNGGIARGGEREGGKQKVARSFFRLAPICGEISLALTVCS